MIEKVSIQPQIKYSHSTSDLRNTATGVLQPQNALSYTNAKKPAFKGVEGMLASGANSLISGATWVLQQCNVNPMFGVSLIDCLTAIFPRTWVDAKTNGFAAAETFRRESSGLIVNCLIPGFIVLGVAKVLEKFGKDNKGLSKLWANQRSTETLSGYFSNAKGNTAEYISGVFKDIEFNSGKDWNKIDLDNAEVKTVLQKYQDVVDGKIAGKEASKVLKETELALLKHTGGAENIRFIKDKKPLGQNLSLLLRDMSDLKPFFAKHINDLSKFEKQIEKFVNKKSLVGLAIVIPLAASMQSINRWITRIRSGQEGAPIYKDFVSKKNKKEMTKSEKSKFWMEKIGAAALMVAVAYASLKDKSSLKNIFKGLQFTKNMPTMDQCRWIATATFASRMLASEDQNELKEVTWRDIATFGSLYMLCDYVPKGVASFIKKVFKIDLLNYTKEAPEKTKNKFKQTMQNFKHWVNDIHLKTFDETALMLNKYPNAKNLRAICELSSLGFSMLILGMFVPWYVRKQTEIKHKKELEENLNSYHLRPMINIDRPSARRTFQAFGMIGEPQKQGN